MSSNNFGQSNVINAVKHSSLPISSYNILAFLTQEEEDMPSMRRGKHILVLGASGRLGSQVVQQALDASYHVTILVRNDRSLPFSRRQLKDPNLVICVGSIFSRIDLDRVIEGQDAVINCLSPRTLWTSDIKLNSRAQRLINESMVKFDVKRLIIVRCHGTPTIDSFFTRLLSNKVYHDKKVQEKLIMENSEFLDWTIIRVGGLSNGKLTKKYLLLDNDEIVFKKVSRADVAHFILKEIGTGMWVKQAPLINGKV
ncbi:3655_t:CDS:2 [Ambispora leptoticha]|uniref:3655_t:CDS:1 n=1 Tax=Ambispora leptoticha TaxID=144679 RepID=A0A9N8WL48_9GLOM|nr:3655_t:CDS:2 [Ambispora leptoticha]